MTTAADHRTRAVEALANALELAIQEASSTRGVTKLPRRRYIEEALDEHALAVRLEIEESKGR